MFPDETEVRTLERQLDLVIEDGVTRIIELLGVDNAKEASEAKKLAEKMKTEKEKADFEDSLEVSFKQKFHRGEMSRRLIEKGSMKFDL